MATATKSPSVPSAIAHVFGITCSTPECRYHRSPCTRPTPLKRSAQPASSAGSSTAAAALARCASQRPNPPASAVAQAVRYNPANTRAARCLSNSSTSTPRRHSLLPKETNPRVPHGRQLGGPLPRAPGEDHRAHRRPIVRVGQVAAWRTASPPATSRRCVATSKACGRAARDAGLCDDAPAFKYHRGRAPHAKAQAALERHLLYNEMAKSTEHLLPQPRAALLPPGLRVNRRGKPSMRRTVSEYIRDKQQTGRPHRGL